MLVVSLPVFLDVAGCGIDRTSLQAGHLAHPKQRSDDGDMVAPSSSSMRRMF